MKKCIFLAVKLLGYLAFAFALGYPITCFIQEFF